MFAHHYLDHEDCKKFDKNVEDDKKRFVVEQKEKPFYYLRGLIEHSYQSRLHHLYPYGKWVYNKCKKVENAKGGNQKQIQYKCYELMDLSEHASLLQRGVDVKYPVHPYYPGQELKTMPVSSIQMFMSIHELLDGQGWSKSQQKKCAIELTRRTISSFNLAKFTPITYDHMRLMTGSRGPVDC